MTTTYRQYIRTELVEQAVSRYPNNPRLQLLYQIGFLQAQLAWAMQQDNLTYYRFKQCINEANEQLKKL
jgi:hypothetical protein